MTKELKQELELIEQEIARSAQPCLAENPELNAAIDRLMTFCGRQRAE